MKRTILLMAVVLAVCLLATAGMAQVYSVVQGLADNCTTATTWQGSLLTQPGVNGWHYYSQQADVYPWTGTYGAAYVWETNLSNYTVCPVEYAPGGGDWSYGWYGNTAAGYQSEANGLIGNSDETCERKFGTTMGTTVAFRNGWNTQYFKTMAIEWRAPQAGIASVNLTCYSAAGNSGAEFHLGLYRQGVFSQQLDWKPVLSVTNTGVGNGVGLGASGVNLNAGDSIVILCRSDNYAGNGNKTMQQNAAVAGTITLSQNTPGTISGTIYGPGSAPIAGATVTAGPGSATSAADGTYSMAVDPGTYTVTASKIPGYANNSVSGIVVTSGANHSGVNVTLTPWGTISGTVSDAFGPVVGATVSTNSSYPVGYMTATTDGSGHYSVSGAAGSYTVYAKAVHHVDNSVAGVSISDNTNTTQNISLASWGKLTGTVSGSGGVISGATVADSTGVYTANTAADGTYTIFIPAGSYPMTAKKPGLEPSTQTVAMTNDTLTTQNFTLGDGIVISGTVTESAPGNAPVAGVSVWPADGSNSATTDSAGHYSLGVSRGTYIVGYSKPGYAPKFPTVAAPTTNVTQNIVLNKGWDFATEFTNANPNGVWTYGYDLGTGGTFTNMPLVNVNYAGLSGIYWTYPSFSNNLNNGTGFLANTLFTSFLDPSWLTTQLPRLPAWREGQKVIASSGFTYNGMTGNERSIARFTAPFSGYYTVTAKFSGVTPAGTTTGVAVRDTIGASSSYLLGNPVASPVTLNGFAGTANNLYADSTGANPVVVYSQTRDVQEGEMIDAILYGMNTGWTQVDMTVTYSGTFIKGKVTSDLPGNPPVIEAKVGAPGSTIKYTGLTNGTGDYLLSVAPDVYDMEALKGGYDMGTGSATVALGGVATSNMTMHHKGVWDVAVDFTTLANPAGQWSYGSFDQSTAAPLGANTWTLATQLHSGETYDHRPANLTEWVMPSFWQGWLGKNFGGQPNWGSTPSWNIPANYYWIEPGDLFIKSGDRDALASFRWTATSSGAYDIYCRVFSQCGAGGPQGFSILKNSSVLAKKVVDGFMGSNAAGYSDSIGPAPAQVFNLTIPINSGEVVDFAHDFDYQTLSSSSGQWTPGSGTNLFPPKTLGVQITISKNTSIVTCNTVADLKNAIANSAVGTKVMMLSPLSITAAQNRYQDYTIYVESDDRSQAFKLVGDATTTLYPEGWKITFTGQIVNDPTDATRKVLQVISVNSGVAGTELKPLGMTTKSVNTVGPTARDKFVRVFGMVKSVVANTDSATNVQWPYEYYVINDGGQDLKIKMHGESTWMNDPTPLGAATIGHFIAAKGIVIKEGTDMVLFPRGYGSGLSDIDDYKQTGAQP